MEDIYNNLENYNEVNALEELRSENMEMKVKLEQYATAMEKLQKEFDTLSSEFRKLEFNYSSLLKTAKAEIERKTKIITNINIEKDMLVLSALQNGNKNILNTKTVVPDNKQTHKKTLRKKGVKNTKDLEEKKKEKCESIKESLQENQTPLDETVHKMSKENTQQVTPVNNHETKADVCNEGKASAKENTKHELSARSVSPIAINVKKRRKSIPYTDVGSEKISSDEMSDCPPGGYKNNNHVKHREDQKYFPKNNYDNHVSKISEVSTKDEKTFDPSREIFIGRPEKHYDGDKHRKRDKFDKPKRYKRHYSPDRYNRRVTRDYYDDYHRRPEVSRSRGRESPIDCVYHNSYKDHRQYEKNYPIEQERFSYGPDRNIGKHKILHEYDEPNRKRRKTESYNRLKDNGKYHDRESYKDQELAETFEKLQEQYISCQSPDYIGCDATTPEPIKEIMNTAETQLEDPRLSSHKYILNKDKSSASLTTINSTHVDLIPVDKSKWGMKKISMPNALIQLPPEQQLLNYLNTDIEENLSIESGEIVDNLQNKSKEHFENNIITENKSSNQSNNICVSQNVAEKENNKTIGCFGGYKIPKIKKCEMELKSKDREKTLDEIEHFYINKNKNGEHKIVQQRSKSPSDNHDSITKHDGISGNKLEGFGENNINLLETERIFSTREIVEGDLELSDETCDTIEFQKTLIQNAGVEDVNDFQKSKTHSKIEDTSKTPSNHDQLKESIRSLDYKLESSCAKKSLHDGDNIPQNKKQRIQKNSQKYKETDFEINDKNVNKSRSKKEEPKMVRKKFTELFGDSSSLITPDDLGISSSQIPSPSELTANYVPIFEDAVDASDLQRNTNIKMKLPEIKEDVSKDMSAGRNGKINVLESISKNHEVHKDFHKLENHDKKVLKEPACVIDPLHQDSNLNNLKKSDIVATVIISTGVQPDVNSESRAESLVNADELLTDNIQQDENNDTHRQEDLLLKALATSTPHKEMVTQIANELQLKPSDAAHDSNGTLPNINNDSNTAKSLHLDSNTSNTLEPSNEDLPDVRIFVKRRRRLGKIVK